MTTEEAYEEYENLPPEEKLKYSSFYDYLVSHTATLMLKRITK